MPALQRIVQIPCTTVIKPARQAVGAAALYMLLCSTYILVSGYLATWSAANTQQLHLIETIKGIGFIVVTGLVYFAVSYVRCRTIRRQEESIIVQERALVQAERRLVAGMSAAAVAHDLNNLLMALSGLVQGLKGQERDDPFLLTMRGEVELINDKLSNLSKRLITTVRRAVPEKEDNVDMRAALRELITIVQKHPAGRSCRVVSNNIAPLTIPLNRTLLEEAVLNLLINAAQATGPSGKIEVCLTTEQDATMLAIHDNGPGVSEECVGDIFDACFTTKPDGSGIGLLAVTAFAASCKAEVSVSHSPLGGAMFRILIPTQNQPSGTR